MKKYLKLKCRRQALGMTEKEFADIAKVKEETIRLLEDGKLNKDDLKRIENKTYQYLKQLDPEDYLTTELIEESLYLRYESDEEHVRTLTHIALHASKLNMNYVGVNRL